VGRFSEATIGIGTEGEVVASTLVEGGGEETGPQGGERNPVVVFRIGGAEQANEDVLGGRHPLLKIDGIGEANGDRAGDRAGD